VSEVKYDFQAVHDYERNHSKGISQIGNNWKGRCDSNIPGRQTNHLGCF